MSSHIFSSAYITCMNACEPVTHQPRFMEISIQALVRAVHRVHTAMRVQPYLNTCRYMPVCLSGLKPLLWSFFIVSVLQEMAKTSPYTHPTTILYSLRVQAPKSIERKKSVLWSSPYICQGGKAGGATLMGHTGEQYQSICHKPFHL